MSLVSFKTFAPAQEAKPVAPLGPLVGQYGLNLKQFCDDLNNLTVSYLKGLPLPVYVEKSAALKGGYRILVKPPTLALLLGSVAFSESSEFLEDGATYTAKDLYDVVRVYAHFHGLSLEVSSNLVFAYIGSIQASVTIA
jgi:ribosomal protein L11